VTAEEEAPVLRIDLSLELPRDRLSIPLTRHLVAKALDEVGVVDEDAYAVELALTEACANVVDHAGPGDAYEVQIGVGPRGADIKVVDIGRGFDYASLGTAMVEPSADRGRGIGLMYALMDNVRFDSEPELGTVVHLVKALQFDDDSPTRKLMLAEAARLRNEAAPEPTDQSL
jgi:serine/threonine-protein kinase RsbW